jgi:O-antigen ligase
MEKGAWDYRAFGKHLFVGSASLATLIVLALCLSTLTLWIPTYWPVAAFEITVFLIVGTAVVLGRVPLTGTHFPSFALGFVVLWGCFQLITGFTVSHFATERATLQWITWAAIYYAGGVSLQEENVARKVRTAIVWFAFAVSVEAILQAYISPGRVFGFFNTGYHDFVMGPVVYHTHFAVFIEAILPIALFLTLNEAGRSSAYLVISAVLLTAVVVSASRGGIVIVCVEVLAVLVLSHLRKPGAGRKIRFVALALLSITAILTLIVGFATASERFYTATFTGGRLQFVISTLHMIMVHPWIGWGLGCWPAVYPAFATFDPGAIVNQAHCDWLQWTAEGGLPVGLAMLALALWAIRPALRSIWGVGVIAILVHAAFDYPFSRPAIGAWPILILSMAAAAQSGSNPECSAQGGSIQG